MEGYSIEVCKALEEKFRQASLLRPMTITRYDAGTELSYNVTTIEQRQTANLRLRIEKFVGGGFAGQVYQVRILNIETDDKQLEALKVDGIYAMKILIPPSNFSLLFRNLIYAIGFQAPFQLQTNPAAARAGAIWQKFIKRAAKIKFGTETAVNDIHATFIDNKLGSCGELSDWVDGRTWRLEVNDRMDLLRQWQKGKNTNIQNPGSDEYRAKHKFMADFTELLHEVGAPEFARQYEWWTCKSQPNCLKLKDTEADPTSGLVAVDFRAGLALLPFLPMSPGDISLIFKGIKRGSLVQFDRGSIDKLQNFIHAHEADFSDTSEMLEELKSAEQIYRNSIPDITHNHIRLFYSRQLWSTIFASAITGWKTKNLIDETAEQSLRNCKVLTSLFFLLGLIPFLGKPLRKLCAHNDWRSHYRNILTNYDYFKRSVRGKIAEKVITWHRAGRLDEQNAPIVADQTSKFLRHLPFSILPVCLHRFLTDSKYTKQRLSYIFIRPIRLYFDHELREQWLRDMVTAGRKKHILSDDDANTILSQIKEPFIQKYLVSLVVHLLTLPVTQIVSILVALIYAATHPELSAAETTAAVLIILGLFQIIPISPGSLARGFYVLYLVIRERNFKDYNIAIFLSFFKYIGYLAFPIQMTYHYPAMSRFMAGHWATEAVHIVPVFGEAGALLEHWVFCLFYNWPLTIRLRMQKRAKLRAETKPRYWHIPICAAAATAIFAAIDYIYLKNVNQLPALTDIWAIALLVPLFCGTATTLAAAGADLWKRIIAATAAGILLALLYTAASAIMTPAQQFTPNQLIITCLWRVFAFAVFSTIGAIVTELKLPSPDLK